MTTVYADNAATTQMSCAAIDAMSALYGNDLRQPLEPALRRAAGGRGAAKCARAHRAA